MRKSFFAGNLYRELVILKILIAIYKILKRTILIRVGTWGHVTVNFFLEYIMSILQNILKTACNDFGTGFCRRVNLKDDTI